MFGLEVLGEFLERLRGGAGALNDLGRTFNRRGINYAGLDQAQDAVGGFIELLRVSADFAKFLGFGRESVFTAASTNPQISLNRYLQESRNPGDLSAVGQLAEANNTRLTPRLRGEDGPVVSVSISPEQLRAMSTFGRGASPVATYGPEGGRFGSVSEYFAANPYPPSA